MEKVFNGPGKKTLFLFYVLLLFMACMNTSAHAEVTQFPIADPYKATIFGTPPELMYKLKEPTSPDECEILIEERRIPNIFWYDEKFYYSTAMQDEEAPLLFIIAGTGSEHDSAKMRFLTQLFYEAGFHVVALSSPTHMNFVVSFSKYGAPGYVPHDVEDLYRAMKWIKADLEEDHSIRNYSITGYSLGGMHSAFLAKMDEERKDFHFRRVLMLNPPVSLYTSALRFDSWLSPENLGNKTPRQVIDELIEAFSEIYVHSNVVDLDDNFLYALSQHTNFSNMDMKAIIAAAFRMSSSSMIFSSDVCLNAGYVVPVNRHLGVGDNLMPYHRTAAAITFEDYMDEYLLPYLQFLKPGTTKGELVKNCDLDSIREYLNTSEKIFVLGNEDDIILDNADLEFLKKTFGYRATFFPRGGHCGNIMFGPYARKAQELIK
ncbi:alpha/beta fold hydrolase [Desulfovibrio sp. JC010]|uniref:alpha/beta fold hydrolase n=1 Tax=Desulfovibrio sp. JC010 TaxID=2593641 RepID=UPI0013D4DD37|nr:alpha/beta fold hydrolase [Desulfovibrio sp. JC010]NDV25189.1 alpha/beta hydrolase [Desulfovibrio sp. JC010]